MVCLSKGWGRIKECVVGEFSEIIKLSRAPSLSVLLKTSASVGFLYEINMRTFQNWMPPCVCVCVCVCVFLLLKISTQVLLCLLYEIAISRTFQVFIPPPRRGSSVPRVPPPVCVCVCLSVYVCLCVLHVHIYVHMCVYIYI